LVSWWDLDEESGTRADAVGSNDLTDNNTVGYAVGKIGNAANFVDTNNETLSVTYDLHTASPSGCTQAFWLKSGDTASTPRYPFDINRPYGPFLTTYLRSDSTAVNITVSVYDTGWQSTTSGWTTAPIGWVHIAYTIAVSGAITLYINGQQSGTPGSFGTWADGGTVLRLGSYDTTGRYLGDMDMCGMWSRVLTSDEITELYNSGSGLDYPFS